MANGQPTEGVNQGLAANDPGDEVMRRAGILDESAAALGELDEDNEVDPERVGAWITVIGRAIMAIFKP